MRLITPPVPYTETFTVVRDERNWWDRLTGGGQRKVHHDRYQGPTRIHPVVIDDAAAVEALLEDKMSWLMTGKIESLQIDGYTLYGVMPMDRLPDGTIECRIDSYVQTGA